MPPLRTYVLPLAWLAVAACAAADGSNPAVAERPNVVPSDTVPAPAEIEQGRQALPDTIPPAPPGSPGDEQAATQPDQPSTGHWSREPITVPGEGAVARCCPRGSSPEQCRNYLGSDLADGEQAQCGGGWTPSDGKS